MTWQGTGLNILLNISKTYNLPGNINIKSPENKHSTQQLSISYKCLTFNIQTKQNIQLVCVFTSVSTSHHCVRTSTGIYRNLNKKRSETAWWVFVFSLEMLLWSCDVSVLVKHRFRSDVENKKQPAREQPVMSLLMEAPAVYGKRNRAVKLHVCSKPPEHDLIRGKPKQCDQQRKARQTTAEQPIITMCPSSCEV